MVGESAGSELAYGDGLRRRSGFLVVASRDLLRSSRCWWHRKPCCATRRLRQIRSWDQGARIVPLPVNPDGVESATTADPTIRDGELCWSPVIRGVLCVSCRYCDGDHVSAG